MKNNGENCNFVTNYLYIIDTISNFTNVYKYLLFIEIIVLLNNV